MSLENLLTDGQEVNSCSNKKTTIENTFISERVTVEVIQDSPQTDTDIFE